MSDIGIRLKEERKKIGKTQNELAKLCGCSSRTQMRYEQGAKFDELYTYKAAQAGIDIGYVLDGVVTALDEVELNQLIAPSKIQRLVNNVDLVDVIVIINSVMAKANLDVTNASKFKVLVTMLAKLEKNTPQASSKDLESQLLIAMARQF